jgi:SPP1 gp7 family putative phage head morphogenesis protein
LYNLFNEKDPRELTADDLPDLVDYQYLLTKILFYSKLYGMIATDKATNSLSTPYSNTAPVEFDLNMPYDEAFAYFNNLGIIDAASFYEELETYAGSAFTISRINNINTLSNIKQYITTQLSETVNPVELKEAIQAFAVSNGDSPLSPSHLQTVVTTNLQTAFSAGQYEILKTTPNEYWQYFNSDPQTELCRELSGIVLKKSDPFWDSYFPPNHFNCHSTVLSLDINTIKEEGLTVSRSGSELIKQLGEDFKPADGFNVTPNKALDKWLDSKCKEFDIDKVEKSAPVTKHKSEEEFLKSKGD